MLHRSPVDCDCCIGKPSRSHLLPATRPPAATSVLPFPKSRAREFKTVVHSCAISRLLFGCGEGPTWAGSSQTAFAGQRGEADAHLDARQSLHPTQSSRGG